MAEFKGTKGDWKAYSPGGKGSCIDIIRDCGNDELEPGIAQVYSMVETDWKEPHNDELKANAKLIAAAPKLLSALQDAVTSLEWVRDEDPLAFNKADDEKLHEWTELINDTLNL